MKGFLGAFIVFVFWASGGIYYISTTNTKLSSNTVATGSAANTDAVTKTSIPVTKAVTEITSEKKSDSIITSDTQVNNDSLTVKENSASSSKILAEELKQSITISDTIDINQGEPEISYEEEILEEETAKNQLFYPRYTQSSELILDRKLVDYATELKALLKENPDKKIIIIGHTDNIGSAKDNFANGLKKSRQVKWYLTARKGIPRRHITATSRGEQEPIEDNNSKWGRKQNNRIEIIIE